MKHVNRMDALRQANVIRIARTEIGREVKSGKRSVESVILDPPEILHTNTRQKRAGTTIEEVLCWQHRWGPERARKYLDPLDINHRLRPCDMGQTTRERLVAALNGEKVEPIKRPAPQPEPSELPNFIPVELGNELYETLIWALAPQRHKPRDPRPLIRRYQQEVLMADPEPVS